MSNQENSEWQGGRLSWMRTFFCGAHERRRGGSVCLEKGSRKGYNFTATSFKISPPRVLKIYMANFRKLIIGTLILVGTGAVWAGLASKKTTSALHLPWTADVLERKVESTIHHSLTNSLFEIKRVIDGDTIELENGERVRYIGMDTPETADPRKPVQCFGREASRKNKELVEGQKVRLEKDVSERDKYGRWLRYVWVGNVFINLELVKQGFAYAYSYPPDIKYQEQFRQAEQDARRAKLGLWSACPSRAGR